MWAANEGAYREDVVWMSPEQRAEVDALSAQMKNAKAVSETRQAEASAAPDLITLLEHHGVDRANEAYEELRRKFDLTESENAQMRAHEVLMDYGIFLRTPDVMRDLMRPESKNAFLSQRLYQMTPHPLDNEQSLLEGAVGRAEVAFQHYEKAFALSGTHLSTWKYFLEQYRLLTLLAEFVGFKHVLWSKEASLENQTTPISPDFCCFHNSPKRALARAPPASKGR